MIIESQDDVTDAVLAGVEGRQVEAEHLRLRDERPEPAVRQARSGVDAQTRLNPAQVVQEAGNSIASVGTKRVREAEDSARSVDDRFA